MRNAKKMLVPAVALILVMCLSIAGIAAYLTAKDSATNEFTIGNISIELQEPNWDPEAAEGLNALEEVAKDPKILNDGVNAAYVFLEVVVPYKNMATANADGTRNDAANTPLFTWTTNEGWIQVGDAADNGDGTFSYVYAWATGDDAETGAMNALAAEATTGTLFDEVAFANVVSDQVTMGEQADIVVNAYGIQTNDINGGVTAPADVWTVMSNIIESEPAANEG